ncbi:MAG TPA: potassium-transporting ATPase subunit KdpC [Bacteroidales bacterium]|nr:potassium-transporting ATPase subunit KdpC [Bacteroidales bacterium]
MKTLLISIKIFLLFMVLTGILYPLFITGIAQLLFPSKANGSLILRDNKIIGSELIGQQFDSTIYFTSRPSAIGYNPLPSGGSNYGLTNSVLKQQVNKRRQQFIQNNLLDSVTDIPAEMLFASASGLDPHISKQAAMLQADRVAKAREFNEVQKQQLFSCLNNLTETPMILGPGTEKVNVLLLNLEVDKIK